MTSEEIAIEKMELLHIKIKLLEISNILLADVSSEEYKRNLMLIAKYKDEIVKLLKNNCIY